MSNIWLQIILTAGTVISGMFLTIRYSILQTSKKEKVFLDFLKENQDKQLEYYEKKNGHLERISMAFTKTLDKNTRALDKLSARIKDKVK